MKCNIIGAGRLGKNIALALSQSQMITSLSLCNRSLESAEKACQEIGFGQAFDKIEQLPKADVTWICCNDDAIMKAVAILNQHSILTPGNFIIHCSGVLSSTLLAPLKDYGCFVASFHPLKAFKINYLNHLAFNQVNCIFEGDLAACKWLNETFSKLGANLISIKPEAKADYHAAACMASNYLITLAYCSEELFRKAGINSQQSRKMMLQLMQGNINNLQQAESISESLTGPLARGDLNTLKLHLSAIQNPEIKRFYQSAGLSTLSLTELTNELKQKVRAILNNESIS